jgi:hypothetical protein
MSCCTQRNGLGSLGQEQGGSGVDPATLIAIQQAFVHAKDLWDDLKAIFGIGAGAKEADAIVPLQNEVHATFLAPLSAYLDAQGTKTCAEIQTWQTQFALVQKRWIDFLHGTQWTDGRAAQQAEATLAPYFSEFGAELAQLQKQLCGVLGGGGGIITNPDGSTNWPIVAAGAGLLFVLMRK